MTGQVAGHYLTGVPVIPRGSRLHGASPFSCVSSACETDVSHRVMRGSNPRPVLQYRRRKAKEWTAYAQDLDRRGLFVAARMARAMAAQYRR